MNSSYGQLQVRGQYGSYGGLAEWAQDKIADWFPAEKTTTTVVDEEGNVVYATTTNQTIDVAEGGYTFRVRKNGRIEVLTGPANVGRIYKPADAAYVTVVARLYAADPRVKSVLGEYWPGDLAVKAVDQPPDLPDPEETPTVPPALWIAPIAVGGALIAVLFGVWFWWRRR